MTPPREHRHPTVRNSAVCRISCFGLLLALLVASLLLIEPAPTDHQRAIDVSIAASATTYQYLFPNGSEASEIGDSAALATMLTISLGLPSNTLQNIAGDTAGIINRAPPSAGFFDGFLEGHTLVSYSDGTGTVVDLVYSNTGSSNGYILAIDVVLGNLKPPAVSRSQYANYTLSILESLGVPLETLSKESLTNLSDNTTVVFSSEFESLGFVGCNLAAFTFSNSTGELLEVQLRPFLTLPSTLSLTPDDAITTGRSLSRTKFLDPDDVVVQERLTGIRFVAKALDANSSIGGYNNLTTSATIDIRFGYEYLVTLSSVRNGQNYSILAVVDVDTGEGLVVARGPVPIENERIIALPFWAMLVVLIVAPVVVLAVVAVSPEIAVGLIGSLIAPLYMRLRGSAVLDDFNRGRLYGYIIAKPGATFTELKVAFNIGNGNLAYHLSVLERLELIRSRKEGRTRRFYGQGVKIESLSTQYLGRTEARVLEEIERRGPVSNTDLARWLGMSRQRIHYNLKLLRSRGLVEMNESKWCGTGSSECDTADG
jgi:predicted transcriptional regulator